VAVLEDQATDTPTPPPALEPPNLVSPSPVLIPVTGMDYSLPVPLAKMQTTFGNLGLALIGLGLVLQGLSRRIKD